jgi:hypothetical protein
MSELWLRLAQTGHLGYEMSHLDSELKCLTNISYHKRWLGDAWFLQYSVYCFCTEFFKDQ